MRLLLFEKFIQEKLLLEAKINISSTILDVLKKLVGSKYSREDWVKWANLILSAVKSGVDYPDNEIDYLYSDSGKIFQKYRGKDQEVKLGRALQKILTSIDPKTVLGYPDYPDFLRYIEGSLVELPPDEYQLVSGDDIAKYYNTASTNMIEGTTLFKSCMHSKDPNTFNLYTKNPDVISLLVHLDGGKVSTRALVWKLDGQGGVDYFVDRIYSNDDPLTKIVGIEKFIESKFPGKKYAIKQKDENWIGGVNIKLKLKNLDFTLYPYVDSFSYLYFPLKNVDMETLKGELNPDSGFLSNNKEWEKCPEYLCFELLDHKFATRTPLNCKIIDKIKGMYYNGNLFYLLTQEQRGRYAMKEVEKGKYITNRQFELLEPDQRFQYAMKIAEGGESIPVGQFTFLQPEQQIQYLVTVIMRIAAIGLIDDYFKLLTPEQQNKVKLKVFQYAMKRAQNGQFFFNSQFKILTQEQMGQYAMKMAQNGRDITYDKFELLTQEQMGQYVMKMVEKGNDIEDYQFELLTPEQRIKYKEKRESFLPKAKKLIRKFGEFIRPK